MLYFRIFTLLLLVIATCKGKTIDFEADVGAIADDTSSDTAWKNGGLLNTTLSTLQPGDKLVIPNKKFTLIGGIYAKGLNDVTISIDGELSFLDELKNWPRDVDNNVRNCITFDASTGLVITSSQPRGTLEGNGATWWGIPLIGYLVRGEDRPMLLEIMNSKNVLVENLLLHNSPYWTFWAHEMDGLEVRHVDIQAARTGLNSHGPIDLTAFNTDGFDVTGKNVWIHDCTVWNQDDCIAVKDGSENMLFERISASGLGLTIGSIGTSSVKNITFRDITMPNTFKGIYLKFRDFDYDGGVGHISDVTFENIVMDKPEQYAIWIGPAQQSDSDDLCAAHPCSLCWPTVPLMTCSMPDSTYDNILLKNVTINDPIGSVGMIMGGEKTPMNNVEFRDVVVNNPSKLKKQYVACENVDGVATGASNHIPPCFNKK